MDPSAFFETKPPAVMHNERESSKMSDLIETIVLAAESRHEARHQGSLERSYHQVDDTIGGPLTSNEISKLSMICAAVESEQSGGLESSAGFGAVEPDLIASLFPHLQTHVTSAVSVNLVRELHQVLREKGEESSNGKSPKSVKVDKWLRGSAQSDLSGPVGPGILRFFVLRNGLETASILLSIMSSKGISQRLLNEDSIESCVALLRQHLSQNIIPALTSTGHLLAQETTKTEQTLKTKKRKRQSSAAHTASKELKKVYKLIISSISQFLAMFERMEKLVYKVPLDDRPVVSLCSSALSIFTIEPSTAVTDDADALTHLLHIASIGLMTAVCRRYPQHRPILVEDLFPTLLKLPTSKRYLRSFPLLSSHFSSNQPTRRRPAARRLFTGDQPDSIQPITVLILTLIQSCVVRPRYANTAGDESEPTHRQFLSGVLQCQSLCDMFVSLLLQRCSKRGEDGGASEFRPVLNNLVDDLLTVQLIPEFPASEVLLQTICRYLGNDLMRASSTGSSKSKADVESTYLTTGFDVLGKICASLAQLLANHRQRPLTINRQIENESQTGSAQVNSCHCGRSTLVDTFMLNCDRCHGWFHGECVGVTKEMVEDVWFCADCRLKEMAIEETRTFAARSQRFSSSLLSVFDDNDQRVPTMIETHIFRQLVLSHLTDQEQHTDSVSVELAREFLLARWIEDLNATSSKGNEIDFDPDILCRHLFELWDRPQLALFGSRSRPQSRVDAFSLLNKEGYNRLMTALAATTSEHVLMFPRRIGLLMQLMSDEALVSMRKLAIKAITQVIDSDQTLMLLPSLKKAVTRRFRDNAKSVREAVVGLVGSYVVQVPEVADAFHSSLLPSLSDPGVSVRKRAIKIYRDILISNPAFTGRAQACTAMLTRAVDPKEDDTVRDLIHDLFTELWLENTELPESAFVTEETDSDMADESQGYEEEKQGMQSIAGVVTPISKDDYNENASQPSSQKPGRRRSTSIEAAIQIRCRVASQHMIEVIQAAGSKEGLGDLLKSLLSDVNDSDKSKKSTERRQRRETLKSHCSHLVEALIDHLLTLEEQRPKKMNVLSQELIATLRTMAVFAEVSPADLLKHLETLLPYLKADNGLRLTEEADVVVEVCDVVSRVSVVMTRGDILALGQGSICDDIIKITYRFGSGAISSSVRVLCRLAQHNELESDSIFSRKLLKLARTFYSYLFPLKDDPKDFSKAGIKVRSNVQRALSVLGSICRNLKPKDGVEEWVQRLLEDPEQSLPRTITWDDLVESSYGLFSAFLAKIDVETKCAALKALTGIFVSRPRILLLAEQSGTIVELMSDSSHHDIKIQALKCWKEILVAEEKRLESGEAKDTMDADENITLSKRISGDQDSDATLVGGVVAHHCRRLYQLTTSRNERIRFSTVDLIAQLLRQGLLNPMEVVPYLLGLQGDVDCQNIRGLALKLLITEGEKRPDMLRQRLQAGIKQAYFFQRSVYPNRDVNAVLQTKSGDGIEVECIFGSIFKECIRNNKKQKHGLFKNLLALFDGSNPGSSDRNKDPKNKLPLLSFAAQVLAHLPYASTNDPLFIIHHIQNIAAVEGAQLLDQLCSFLDDQGVPEIDEFATEEDLIEIAAKKKIPIRSKEASILREKGFDDEGFAKFCIEVSPFILLLDLKSFLRKTYNLSATRCLTYNPDIQERGFDRLSSSPAAMTRFAANFKPLLVKENGKTAIDMDEVIRRYAEFRKLMREELNSDTSQETDSDDEEPSNSKKRKFSEVGEGAEQVVT